MRVSLNNPLASVLNSIPWGFVPINYDSLKFIVFDISKIAMTPAGVLLMLEMLEEHGYVEIDYTDHTIKRI